MVKQPFHSILIYGIGMMGNSLAHSLRRISPQVNIGGVVHSKVSADYLHSQKIINQIIIHKTAKDVAKLAYGFYDLVVFAVPIKQMLKIAPQLPPIHALITDLSSVQSEIKAAFNKRPELRFINSHPLCGCEKTGPSAAVPDLYRGCLCLLSNDAHLRAEDINQMEKFWRSLGMLTCQTKTNIHDEALARLSHIPHLISGLLCLWADESRIVRSLYQKTPLPPIGGGFQDIARIAGSNPKMWVDILETNKEALIAAFEKFEKDTSFLLKALKKEKPSYWLNWFKRAAKARARLLKLQ